MIFDKLFDKLFGSPKKEPATPENPVAELLKQAGADVFIEHGEPTTIEFPPGSTDSDLALALQCPQLQQLSADWCFGLTEDALTALSRLPALERLSLKGTAITGNVLAAFAGHARLNSLELDGCDLHDDDLEPIGRIPRLTTLFVRFTELGIPALKHIVSATRLEVLHLDGTKVRGEAIGGLRALRQLQVLSLPAGVTSADLSHLNGFGSLRWVWLSDAEVDHEGLQAFRETLNPMCSVSLRRRD